MTLSPVSIDSRPLPRLNTYHAVKFVAALRSGDYEQTTAVLCRVPVKKGYRSGACCLGIESILAADDVAIKVTLNVDAGTLAFDGNEGMPPLAAVQWLYPDAEEAGDEHGLNPWRTGLLHNEDENNVVRFNDLNDDWSLTFAQIADVFCWAHALDRDGYPVRAVTRYVRDLDRLERDADL